MPLLRRGGPGERHQARRRPHLAHEQIPHPARHGPDGAHRERRARGGPHHLSARPGARGHPVRALVLGRDDQLGALRQRSHVQELRAALRRQPAPSPSSDRGARARGRLRGHPARALRGDRGGGARRGPRDHFARAGDGLLRGQRLYAEVRGRRGARRLLRRAASHGALRAERAPRRPRRLLQPVLLPRGGPHHRQGDAALGGVALLHRVSPGAGQQPRAPSHRRRGARRAAGRAGEGVSSTVRAHAPRGGVLVRRPRRPLAKRGVRRTPLASTSSRPVLLPLSVPRPFVARRARTARPGSAGRSSRTSPGTPPRPGSTGSR